MTGGAQGRLRMLDTRRAPRRTYKFPRPCRLDHKWTILPGGSWPRRRPGAVGGVQHGPLPEGSVWYDGKGRTGHRGGSVGSSSRPETGLATSISSSIWKSRHPRWAVPSRLSLLLRCLLLPFIEEGEMTNEGGGGLCVIHPAAPRRKQIGSSLEGNRIVSVSVSVV